MVSQTEPNPIAVLRDYERRSLAHAIGLPQELEAQGSWPGVTFRLADAYLVSPLESVGEILALPGLTPVPGAKSWVLGIANVRGNLYPIVDLKAYLANEAIELGKASRVLIVGQEGGSVGLLVEEVHGMRHFMDDEMVQGQTFGDSVVADYIDAEYEKDGVRWGLFNLTRLVSQPAFMQAAA